MEPTDRAPTAGVGEAAQQLVASLIDIGRTRLELVAVELEEERLRLARLWLNATVALFLLFVGVLLTVAWVVMWCEPAQRVKALGGFSAVFLGAAALAIWRWRELAARKPLLLHATLGELARDCRPAPTPPHPVRNETFPR